ncbi:hypothetical protein TVAG_239720 [Trichomonas vaginalis G3]|uniref:Uncharacterized protein n=1 Tax=Trichomonas vaginalis (strain ATCC PRA-98 / G3) TaxID=412133 RepID=A2EFB5_TRIV3|nr:hypothetical protein TVAGG3_0430670 [Trichomonas vaginalis G3]EAY08612.1 hypothetical protein TVAG_239720 [Trichomonas vaginalis G3]KAI5536726.1 hypothetical protein TVAGG3_0430670 [Trichomonas vaginalis G3]|eukprot:XP_001320835.1 hypothetical protein [Trichomonas vaginalis G3]
MKIELNSIGLAKSVPNYSKDAMIDWIKSDKMISFFFISAIYAKDDDNLGPARDLLVGKWNAEISRTDSKGNTDDKENELVEVRFNLVSKRTGLMKMGVYPDSSSKEPYYEAEITWDSNGNSATIESSAFSTSIEFYLLTKYEARGTADNFRYLFEIVKSTEAQATFTDTETNEKTTVKLYRDESFFASQDWLPTIIGFGFFGLLIAVAIIFRSPEASKREEERMKRMQQKKEQDARKQKNLDDMARRYNVDDKL